MKLKDKVAIVTGAASGIGAEVARVFTREGAKVALVDRDGIAAPPVGSLVFQGDVSDGTFTAATVAEIVKAWGRVDVVLTAAGMSVGKKLADTTEEEWDRVFAVNAKGTFLWLRATLAPMIASGGGSMITVASQIPLSGGRNTASYASSKGAVIALTKSVALEVAKSGIRVNGVEVCGKHPVVRPQAGRVATVFQDSSTALNPLMTLGKQLRLALPAACDGDLLPRLPAPQHDHRRDGGREAVVHPRDQGQDGDLRERLAVSVARLCWADSTVGVVARRVDVEVSRLPCEL